MTAGDRPIVYKFGGSSLGDGERMGHAARLAAEGPPRLVVVVSALQGVTDRLERIAEPGGATNVQPELDALLARHVAVAGALSLGEGEHAVIEALTERAEALGSDLSRRDGDPDGEAVAAWRDEILAAGEDLSTILMAAAIRSLGRSAYVVDARHVVRTNERFGCAIPEAEALTMLAEEHLRPVTATGCVAVVQGFVGSTEDGRTTTLGRGGSDFTAALLGGALDAEMVHVWTDVSGVLSGDPAQVERPGLLDEVGFEEAVELAWAGARVIHPVAAKWAVARGVTLRIRNTFHPGEPGTLVRHDVRGTPGIAAVTHKPGVALIRVRSHPWALPYGFLARVFDVLARHQLEVDLVATSHSSTAFTIDESAELEAVADELEPFAEVEVRRDLTTITLVGRGLLAEPGMDALIFEVVRKTPVHLISQASDVSMSFVVDDTEAPGLVRRLHAELIEGHNGAARRMA